MSDTIYVAFATQKGGAGKSTLTALVASYLRYVEGVEVAVIDCDNTQHSMNVYREHDLLVTNENPRLKRIMHKFYLTHTIKPYQILMTSPGDAVKVAEDFVKAGNNPKVVFFDITGTINNRDIVNLIAKMHYIFVPITTETGKWQVQYHSPTMYITG